MMSSVITLRLNRCATTASTVRTTAPASRTAARHPPGCGGTSASGVLLGRVHVPLQSPNLKKSRQAILAAHATGSNHSADAYAALVAPSERPTEGPQQVVAT